jgi:hypothetical protein
MPDDNDLVLDTQVVADARHRIVDLKRPIGFLVPKDNQPERHRSSRIGSSGSAPNRSPSLQESVECAGRGRGMCPRLRLSKEGSLARMEASFPCLLVT